MLVLLLDQKVQILLNPLLLVIKVLDHINILERLKLILSNLRLWLVLCTFDLADYFLPLWFSIRLRLTLRILLLNTVYILKILCNYNTILGFHNCLLTIDRLTLDAKWLLVLKNLVFSIACLLALLILQVKVDFIFLANLLYLFFSFRRIITPYVVQKII